MTTLKVTHSCGHEASHARPRNDAERRQREEWLARRPCPACWRESQQRTAEARREAWSLPPLEGTEEEKAWAEVIRMKAIAHNRDYHSRVINGQNFRSDEEDIKAAVREAADRALGALETQTSAAWWVENRFESLNYIKQEIVAAITPILNARKEAQAKGSKPCS